MKKEEINAKLQAEVNELTSMTKRLALLVRDNALSKKDYFDLTDSINKTIIKLIILQVF